MSSFYNVLFNNALLLGWIGGLLLLAYISYQVLFFIFGRLFYKNIFISELRYPVLFLFLEIALFAGIDLLDFSEDWESSLHHFVTVLFIATIGWGLIKIAVAFEKRLRDRSDQGVYITRAKIFYRTLVFLIATFTFASILMTFPVIRSFGIGILGSAGIAGIALGIAARPILLNLMAGFQIALTKMLKIGDHVVMEKEQGTIEEIYLTHVILKTSDLRRVLFPISFFIDKPFENWDRVSEELVGHIYLYCDYRISIEKIRNQVEKVLDKASFWNRKMWKVEVTDYNAEAIEVRISVSANNAAEAFDLKCYVREEMLKFLQAEYPQAFPHQRHIQSS